MIQRGSIREALSTWMEAESLVYATHEQRYFLSEQLPKKSKARKMCQSTAKQEIRDEFEINPSLSLCQSRCPPNLVRFLAIFSLIPPHWGRQGNIFPNTWWGTLHYFPLQRVTVEEDADERPSPRISTCSGFIWQSADSRNDVSLPIYHFFTSLENQPYHCNYDYQKLLREFSKETVPALLESVCGAWQVLFRAIGLMEGSKGR